MGFGRMASEDSCGSSGHQAQLTAYGVENVLDYDRGQVRFMLSHALQKRLDSLAAIRTFSSLSRRAAIQCG